MDMALALAWYLVFLFSTTAHEAAHTLAAKWGGDSTAADGGQLTLDPIPHMQREPLGMLAVPFLSLTMGGYMIGWASAPYCPIWASRHPHRAAWMALAGPAANLLIALICGLLLLLGLWNGWFTIPELYGRSHLVDTPHTFLEPIAGLLSIGVNLNLILFVLNLIPLPPLDGSAVVTLLMSEDKARRLQDAFHTPVLGLLGMLIAFKVLPTLIRPLDDVAMALLYLLS